MLLTEGQLDGVEEAEVNVDLRFLLGAGGAGGGGAQGLPPRGLPLSTGLAGVTLHDALGVSGASGVVG